MKTFEYVIKDEIGMHARPAGLLAKEAKNYASKIVVIKGDKQAEATKLMALMGMAIKHGDKVEVRISGEDEETAAAAMQKFFEENL